MKTKNYLRQKCGVQRGPQGAFRRIRPTKPRDPRLWPARSSGYPPRSHTPHPRGYGGQRSERERRGSCSGVDDDMDEYVTIARMTQMNHKL